VIIIVNEKKTLSEETIEIINELLTTLIYTKTLKLLKRLVTIVIGILIKQIKGFQYILTASKIAGLVLKYIAISEKNELKEGPTILKFTKIIQ